MEEIIKEKNQEIKIPVDGLFKDFKDHLDINGNFKILFSGKFGIGKSYFLKEFFENHKDDYEVFHLFPINYQISSNEDIFDFLKYDILIELLNKDKQRIEELKKEGFIELFDEGEKNYLFSFIKEKFSLNLLARKGSDYIEELGSIKASFLTNSIEFDFGLGKMLGRFLKDLLIFDEELQKYKKGDSGKIEEFIQKIKPRIVTETDIFSQIIKEKVESLKNLKNKKQSVLILDDLDRMDPEHIFRILNVFSAHFEKTEQNKFGFDKIILVADYKNLKSIFHHKYGENTDESGYFDKFFDIEVYNFSNEKIVESFLNVIISEIKVKKEYTDISLCLNYYNEKANSLAIFLRVVLSRALNLSTEHKLNLRRLLIGTKFQLNFCKNRDDDIYLNNFNTLFWIYSGISILVSIFGNLENLQFSLQKIKLNSNFIVDKNNDLDIFLKTFLIEFNLNKEEFIWNGFFVSNKNSNLVFKKRVENYTGENLQIVSSELIFFEMLIYYTKNFYLKENIGWLQEKIKEAEYFLKSKIKEKTDNQNSQMDKILLNIKNSSNNFSPAMEEESELVKQISLDPKNPESYRCLGDFYFRNDRLQDARECYKYVLRLDPRNKRAQLTMARLDRILS